MSSNTPTSFASAAAGQSRSSRHGDGEWSRREGRSANGTMTFRRPSAAPSSHSSQPTSDTASAAAAAAAAAAAPARPPVVDSPPAQTSLPPFDGSQRYSRDELLAIFQGTPADAVDVAGLFVSGWQTTQLNSAVRGWGKSAEGTVPQDPTVCWDANGHIRPIGLQDMTAEEKEMFADVNSTLKPQQPKDASQAAGQAGGGTGMAGGSVNGRKASISHGASYSNNGSNTPSSMASARPTTRRREASDSNPFPSAGLTSPLAGRTPRDEPSWFGRRNADAKESQQQVQASEDPEDEPASASARLPNPATLGRSNGAGSSLGAGTTPLWGASGQAPAAAAAATGAFGSFALPTTIGDKRFGSTRGESRLAHLLPKQDASESGVSTGISAAGAASSGPSAPGGGVGTKDSWRARPRTDTDPFVGDGGHAGATQQSLQPSDTPVKNPRSDFGLSGLHIGTSHDESSIGSPETNPFRSPPAERSSVGAGGGVGEDDHLPHAAVLSAGAIGGGGGPDHAAAFGSTRSAYAAAAAFDGSDRSQTSSVGAKGFPGLGNMAVWGQPLTSSTPDRERAVFSSAFGSSLFSPGTGELPSPGFGGVVPGSGVFGPASTAGTGSLRGTSKLGALFPASMHAQMPAVTQEQESGVLGDPVSDLRQINPLGAIGREAVGAQARDPDMGTTRPGRLFDDPMDLARAGPGGIFTTEQLPQANMLASASSSLPQHLEPGRPSAETPPNAPRTMVMPDRMRWVYLDPQGQTQGPFTGLEMNDWYKANFFTPDLRVRKVEDSEFEPLGQLIRRIGNSREPFLVPQIGIAHGQPSLSGTFAHGDRGTVIPPLVGAFPSYGRTLTAEEQNNLERRKQEEQFILARQREMLAVQHHPFAAGRPGVAGAAGAALHHHSSAHSLQSQPSFGSMTSPLAAGPPPHPGHLGAASGFFDHAGLPPTTQPPMASSAEFLRDEYALQERQMMAGLQQPTLGGGGGAFPPAQPSGLGADPSSFAHLPSVDQLQKDPQGFSERLKEFKQLREQSDGREPGPYPAEASASAAAASRRANAADVVDEVSLERQHQDTNKPTAAGEAQSSSATSLSLTQQVQKTQAAAAAKQRGADLDSAENQASQPELPMPFPPAPGAPSGTPLAAPTAQRTRSTLPDQYATSRSQSETPDSIATGAAQPPPLAPWARDHGTENHRGPSLKEIQEAEAKKAAKAEEAAAAARRIAAEQEAALQREREKAAAVAPGLPTSSTWANGVPTSASTTPASPWAKASTAKTTAAGPAAAASAPSAADKKKTLADIQREEEARKQKTRELAAQSSPGASHGVGKRYADLASRAQPPTVTSASSVGIGSGWATVGAGGKVKTPTSSSSRAVSSAAPAAKPAAVPPTGVRSSSSKQLSGTSGKADGSAAMEEFNKWLHRELSRGIADDIDVNVFADTLLQLPFDQSIISEAVYGSSKTMDGRHFAEEFMRRKKLAEKGVVEKQAAVPSSGDSKTSGGWSEVAKKGTSGGHQKEDSMPAGFKVVPSRKKGRK